MLKNLFVPIYQDQSSIGKFMGFVIRSIWIAYGTTISTIKIIPFLLISVFVLTLPFVGILLILNAII
jgi:hypothetical protein